MNSSSVQECFEHTDLKWRLANIPESAACRGVYFNMLDDRSAEFGLDAQHEYRDFFKLYHFSPVRLYSLKDYLLRMVLLSQIHFGGPNIYRGIFDIMAASWPAWRKTLMGRVSLELLGKDFVSIVKMAKTTIRMSVNYGSFQFHQAGPNYCITSHRNEYNYIQYAMAGALQGIATVCETPVIVEPVLSDPFNGELRVTILEARAGLDPQPQQPHEGPR
jgi:uncharacterized protein (TIGR02265 family)